jgi:Protein of unknown function (DUF2752)
MAGGSSRALSALPHTPGGRALRLAGGGAALLFLGWVGVPLCPLAAATGYPCPGCGLTRATLALLRGHLSEAVAFHPLAPLLVPLLGGFVAYASLAYVRRGRWPGMQGAAAGRMAAAGLLLWALLFGVWIARFYGAFGGPVAV